MLPSSILFRDHLQPVCLPDKYGGSHVENDGPIDQYINYKISRSHGTWRNHVFKSHRWMIVGSKLVGMYGQFWVDSRLVVLMGSCG